MDDPPQFQETQENGYGAWKDYMDNKQMKLEEQFLAARPTEATVVSGCEVSGIFEGVAIYVTGYTVPSADELKRIMLEHGGVYHFYYNPKGTTHVIASNLANAKIRMLKGEKIVRPEWIIDSVQANKVLPCEPYLLYSPLPMSQPTLNFTVQADATSIQQPPECPTTENAQSALPLSPKAQDAVDINVETETTHSLDNIPDIESAVVQPSPNISHALPLPSVSSVDNAPVEITEIGRTEGRALKAGDTNFLTEFYSHSRLHYISSMGLEFRQFVSELQHTSDGTFPGILRLQEWMKAVAPAVPSISGDNSASDSLSFSTNAKIILHIDMDCFFVSVGLRKYSQYREKPVVVSHSSAQGQVPAKDVVETVIGGTKSSMSEIASCNYEARKYGVRNGMLLGEALKLCPELMSIPYDFDGYKEVAKKLYTIASSYTLRIEAVSCDELFMDCSNILQTTGTTPEQLASCLREDVETATECTCSVGIARNCLLARMATRRAKPDGIFYIRPLEESEFIKDEEVRNLPGVGRTLESRLNEMNVHTCADLQGFPLPVLKTKFGPKIGQNLYDSCRGIDHKEIQESRPQHSVSAEVNYGIRFDEYDAVISFIRELATEVANRLQKISAKGRQITLKLKIRKPEASVETDKFMGHGICDNVARSTSLTSPTDDAIALSIECENLFQSINPPVSDIRGIGIQVSKLGTERLPGITSKNTLRDFLQKKNKRVFGPQSAYEPRGRSEPIPMETEPCEISPFKKPLPGSPKASLKSSPRKRSSPLKVVPFKFRAINEHFQPTNTKMEPLDKVFPSKLEMEDKEPRSPYSTTGKLEDSNPPSPSNETSSEHCKLSKDMPIPEVKSLFKEWVSMHKVPLEEDIEVVSGFISGVVSDHDLQRVAIILQILIKSLSSADDGKWSKARDEIIDKIQKKVKRLYGGHLKLH